MRILYIINGEFYSGAERVQDILAMMLPELGFEVHFACLKPDRFPELCQCGRNKIALFPMRSRFDLSPAIKIAGHIRKNSFQLIHTHTPRTAMVGRLASFLSSVPMVHHVHSSTVSDSTDTFRNLCNSIIERCSMIGIKRIISVSKGIKAYLIEQGIDEKRISVVHNGVPTPGLLLDRAKPEGQWIIGVAGLFRPRKGLETLLKALAKLKKKHTVRLRVVGAFQNQDYKAIVMKMADGLGISRSIDWLGFCFNVQAQLCKMDILVLPSLFGEGIPMVILEAMAAGVPVVSTKIRGITEVICNGKEGLLVSPGDSRELSEAISRIISDDIEWSLLRRNAYERQTMFFSDHRMSKKIARIYREVLGL